MKPKLSIITINLNNSEGLRKTIQSVVGQTFKDFEFIIIDGKSKDSSVDIIKENADNITYWISEPDQGVYFAMNKGIEKAKGEYCLFLNSGDWLFDQDTLKSAFLNFPDKDIVYGNMETPAGSWRYPDKLKFSIFFFAGIGHPVSFIRRTLFDQFGYYNTEHKVVSDWEFFILTLVKNGCSYKHIDFTISYFNFDGISSDAKSRETMTRESEEVLRKYFPMMYDDYIELKQSRKELEFYRSSKGVQMIKKLQQSKWYRKIRGV